jgi:hypothetical protein
MVFGLEALKRDRGKTLATLPQQRHCCLKHEWAHIVNRRE